MPLTRFQSFSLLILATVAAGGCRTRRAEDWNFDRRTTAELLMETPPELRVEAFTVDDGWEMLAKVNAGPWDEALFPAADRMNRERFYVPNPVESKLIEQGLEPKRRDLDTFVELTKRKTLALPTPTDDPYNLGNKYPALITRTRSIFVIQRLNAADLLVQNKPVEAARAIASVLRGTHLLSRSVNSRGAAEALTNLRNENTRSAMLFIWNPKMDIKGLRTLAEELRNELPDHGFERSIRAALSLELVPILCRNDNATGYGPSSKETSDHDAWTILDHAHPSPLDRRKTVKLLGEFLRRVYRDMGKLYSQRDKRITDDLNGLCADFPEVLVKAEKTNLPGSDVALFAKSCPKIDNPRGRQFVFSSLLPYPTGLAREFQTRIYEEMLAVCLALRIFEKTHGKLPATLNALTGEGLLKRVPIDLIDGKPLRYSAGFRRMWSIGLDEKDDGGNNTVGTTFRPRDMVFRIPKP